MIAGPSSSGKTTFSHRLSIQLATLGLHPYPLGLDDYYHSREKCPKDENGNYDFECLEALDVELFNQDMHGTFTWRNNRTSVNLILKREKENTKAEP